MKFSNNNYAQAVYAAISEEPSKVSEIAKSLYRRLLKNQQLKNLPPILKKIEEISKEEQGIIEIEIETARPFDVGLREEIKKLFGKKAVLKEKNNPLILGGIILRWGENIFDGSIKRALENIKERISE